MDKTRRGDRDVSISVKNWDAVEQRTPVLIDDIISSGRTMLEALRLLTARRLPGPICIAVHGLFADNSDSLLTQAGARVITTNSVAHNSNAIDVTGILASAIGNASDAIWLRPIHQA
jgi:ribose-phosphate pyrophosphokinase